MLLQCPICHLPMSKDDGYYHCPQGCVKIMVIYLNKTHCDTRQIGPNVHDCPLHGEISSRAEH